MSDRFETLRWGIPGWTLVIGFLVFVLFDYFSFNDDRMYRLINAALASAGIWQALLAGLLIAGAGIPLGFVIYQIYFYLRWNSPFSKDGFLPPLIVGREAELKDTVRDLDVDKLSLGIDWRKELYRGGSDHRGSWYYLSQLFSEAFAVVDTSGVVIKQHFYLLNMLHSLGASHLGLSFGYGLYLVSKWKLSQAELWWSLIAVVIMLGTVALLSREDLRNRNPAKILGMAIQHPAELFLGSLFFLYATLNPALNSLLPFEMPLLFVISLGLLWGWNVKESREMIWAVTIAMTIVVIIVKLSGFIGAVSNLNWPILLSALIYNSFSLAFLKNRQNTRDTLVVLEYYNLRRYLEMKMDG